MFLAGNIFIADSVQTAMEFQSMGYRIMYIGDNQPICDQFIPAPILLPPLDAVNADVDGNVGLFENLYYTHLRANSVAVATIDTMLVALYKGVNIALLFEGDGLSHIDFFAKFMYMNYGIVIGTKTNDCCMDLDCVNNVNITTALYIFRNGAITFHEFLSDLTPEKVYYLFNMDDPIHFPISKLSMELGNPNITPEQIIERSAFIRSYYSNYNSYIPDNLATISQE